MYKKIFLFFVSISILTNSSVTVRCNEKPSVSAKSAIVMECSGGEILYEKNAHARLPMASTTKIMTAICAIESYPLRFPVAVDDKAVGIEGSSIYLEKGEIIYMEDLLYGMMLKSGNDAATAIACEVSGSVEKFAELMNNSAKKYGAKSSNFVNACGLYDDNHYTTASDLAKITAHALGNETFAQIVSTKEKRISNGSKDYDRILKNHNRLLSSYEGCTGVKTGYTKKCGRCLVSSATRDGVSLVCVTLNAPDDWNDHRQMLDFAFSKCRRVTEVQEGEYAMRIGIKNSDKSDIPAYFEKNLEYVCVNGKAIDLEIKCVPHENITAPLNKGDVVGEATLFADGREVDKTSLICADDVNVAEKAEKEGIFTWIKKFLG